MQLTLKIRERQLEELINDNKVLREFVQSLNVRLSKYQDATDRLMEDYTYLKEQYDRLSDNFGFVRQNQATLRSKAEHMLTQIRRVTRRADELAEDARTLSKVIAPTQPNSKNVLKFLGKLRISLEYWGQFY